MSPLWGLSLNHCHPLQGIRLLPAANAHSMPTASGRTGVALTQHTVYMPARASRNLFPVTLVKPSLPKRPLIALPPHTCGTAWRSPWLPAQLPVSSHLCLLRGHHWRPSSLGVWQLRWHQKLGVVGFLPQFLCGHMPVWLLDSGYPWLEHRPPAHIWHRTALAYHLPMPGLRPT